MLFLDEPLSNLDAKLREQMRIELRAVQQRVGLTAVYVTHDQIEALAISDFIGVMSAGRLAEFGTPKEIYDRPKSRFAAELSERPMSSRCRTPFRRWKNPRARTHGVKYISSYGQKTPRSIVIRPGRFSTHFLWRRRKHLAGRNWSRSFFWRGS